MRDPLLAPMCRTAAAGSSATASRVCEGVGDWTMVIVASKAGNGAEEAQPLASSRRPASHRAAQARDSCRSTEVDLRRRSGRSTSHVPAGCGWVRRPAPALIMGGLAPRGRPYPGGGAEVAAPPLQCPADRPEVAPLRRHTIGGRPSSVILATSPADRVPHRASRPRIR